MTITQIVNRIYRLTNTNSASYIAANMLDDINIAYNKVWGTIITADGRWQLDDSNNTDFPIATTNLVSGQNDYGLATSHLEIAQLELKLTSGLWTTLRPIDEQDLAQQGISPSYYQTIQGIPVYYDKLGTSVILYPTPNYSQGASLKVWFERGPNEFTSGDVSTGTKTPGFSSLYHDLIPLWVAYDYWLINDPNMTARILGKIQIVEKTMQTNYGIRDKDDKPRMTALQGKYK